MLTHCFAISYHRGAPSGMSPALALQDFPNNPCWEGNSGVATVWDSSSARSALFFFFHKLVKHHGSVLTCGLPALPAPDRGKASHPV